MIAGDDVYRAILKEIGAEESNMDYLFDDSEDEDPDDEDTPEHDHEGEGCDTLAGDETGGSTAPRQFGTEPSRADGFRYDGDDDLLHQWESEDGGNTAAEDPVLVGAGEGNGGGGGSSARDGGGPDRERGDPSAAPVVAAGKDDGNPGANQPAWKRMLAVANAKQERLLGQMIGLQQAQKESSPRGKTTRPKTEPEEGAPEAGDDDDATPPASSPVVVVLKEIYERDPNIGLSPALSNAPLVQQLSTRNAKLEDQWQAQQKESLKLRDKLTVMQTEFYSQQEQWEKEQNELFSPSRGRSKIPKLRPSTWTKGSSSTKGVGGTQTPTVSSGAGKSIEWISPHVPNTTPEHLLSQELEASELLILQLEDQLEEARTVRESQKDELGDWKDRLKKRDVEHQAFLVRYETEKKSWRDESRSDETRHRLELESREADAEDARQKLQHQIAVNQDLREKHRDESKRLSSEIGALKQELTATQNRMESGTDQHRKQSECVRKLEEENRRLRSDATRKRDLERTQNEIKSQMKLAMEEQTQKAREFQSRIREIEGRHGEEVDFWKSEVDEHRRQIELNSTRMESELAGANTRYEELERKHDKEVKEWQLLLDANMTGAVTDDNTRIEDSNILQETNANTMVIGAGSTSTELLSPIRKATGTARRGDNDGDDTTGLGAVSDGSSAGDSESLPSESMNMIDDLLEELGAMDIERAAILDEINNADENSVRTENAEARNTPEASSPISTAGSVATRVRANDGAGSKTDEDPPRSGTDRIEPGGEEGIPRPLESPRTSPDHEESESASASDATGESEVLDETLHLLNNLKNMMAGTDDGVRHETTVLERLEALSRLMQSPDQTTTGALFSSGESDDRPGVSLGSAGTEPSLAMPDPRCGSEETSSSGAGPWSELVAQLKNRCEFLERDRDDVTRITETILEKERASHRAELEAAVATAEREANEVLHGVYLDSNREMAGFQQTICDECRHHVFGNLRLSPHRSMREPPRVSNG